MTGWQFWVDRGGTFTDIVARRPDGRLLTHKLLSDNPARYADAAVAGDPRTPRRRRASRGSTCVDAVRMGTTVATNALLERKGERTAPRHHPRLRRRPAHRLPEPPPHLRPRASTSPNCSTNGSSRPTSGSPPTATVLRAPDLDALDGPLQQAYDDGIRAVAVVCMHSHLHPDHERRDRRARRPDRLPADLALQRGQPADEARARAATPPVVDAYLSPVLRRYVRQVADELRGRTADVHAVQRRAHRGRTVPRQGRHPVRARRRHRRHGADVAARRLRPCHRLRHGRHVHRRLALRGRVRTGLHHPGSPGYGCARRCSTSTPSPPAAAPSSTSTAAATAWAPTPRAPTRAPPATAAAARSPSPTPTSPSAASSPRHFPAVFGPDGDQPLDDALVRDRFAALARDIRERDRRRPHSGAGRRGLPADRRRQHRQRREADLRAEGPRRHPLRADHLRRRGRPARLQGRRLARHPHRPRPAAWPVCSPPSASASPTPPPCASSPSRHRSDASAMPRRPQDRRRPGGRGPRRTPRRGRARGPHPGHPPRPAALRRHRHRTHRRAHRARRDDRRLRGTPPRHLLLHPRPPARRRSALRGSHRPHRTPRSAPPSPPPTSAAPPDRPGRPSASTPAAPGARCPCTGATDCPPGEPVTGPAIIAEAGSTTVVDDGWQRP